LQIEEDDQEALANLGNLLLSYGEQHFEGPPGSNNQRKGLWPRVLLICGMFEMAVTAMFNHPSLQVDAVHLAIALAYYGLLSVPSPSEASEVEICEFGMVSVMLFFMAQM
jgi:nuclear pore complex protein Nup93